MSEICKRRSCTHQKYEDHEECVLHCDKSAFENNDINIFWEKIRQEYIEYTYPYSHIFNEINIQNIIFPSFQLRNYNGYNFFHNDLHFSKDVSFTKCTFTDDFNLPSTQSLKKISFNDCTFNGTIILSVSNELEIDDSQFRKETALGTFNWNKLTLKSTKFSKKITINVKDNLTIDDCTFRDNLLVSGNSLLDLSLKKGLYRKQLSIKNTKNVTLEGALEEKLVFKSNVDFEEKHENIQINNVTFEKDVPFDQFHNLTIENSRFIQKISFTPTNPYNDIIIDNTTMNDLTLQIGNTLNILNKSHINGNLELDNACHTLTIENSSITEKLNLNKVTNIVLKDSQVGGDSLLSNEYDNVSIKNCSFSNFSMGIATALHIDESEIVGNLDLIGEGYDSVAINNSNISDTIQIGEVHMLELATIKSNPSLKLTHNENDNISIKDSMFADVEIKSVKQLEVSNTTINGTLNLLEEIKGAVTFDDVILKSSCEFPKITSLTFKESKLHEEIYFKYIHTLKSTNDTHFKSEVNFGEPCNTVHLEASTFDKKIKLSTITNLLTIASCQFKDEADFSGDNMSRVDILSSTFENNLLFSSSTIAHINFKSSDDEEPLHNTFLSLVDFSNSKINQIEINYSDFIGELNFSDLAQDLDLSKIKSTTIEELTIKNSSIFDLFYASKNVVITNFTFENSKLSTHNQSEEIEIAEVTINEMKWNKINLLHDINLSEMQIDKFRIGNSNIEHRFRIKYSDIGVFNLISSTFEDLQIIDNKSGEIDKLRELRLKNTTIKNVVLDKLKYESFIMDHAHVSDAKIGNVDFKNGSRETHRFFKNYYDSISDYIKANGYYQQEMDQHYKTSKKFSSEWWILDFGKAVSTFGQSWIKPLLWAFIFTFTFYIFIHYRFNVNPTFSFNEIIKFANPFDKAASATYSGVYGLWALHKVLMTIFIYHFVVAIKRKTRR